MEGFCYLCKGQQKLCTARQFCTIFLMKISRFSRDVTHLFCDDHFNFLTGILCNQYRYSLDGLYISSLL